MYSKAEQDAIALSAVTDAISVVSYDFQPNGLVGLAGEDAVLLLDGIAATFKYAGFAEEREARLVMTSTSPDDVRYRPRGNILVPYIEIPISLDCIKAIHVGPMPEQDAAVRAMQGFCQLRQDSRQEESLNVEYWLEVIASKIPFRAS